MVTSIISNPPAIFNHNPLDVPLSILDFNNEFIRRVPKEKLFEIETKLQNLCNPDEFIAGLLGALSKKWGPENPFISHEDMPYYALLAFNQGKIKNYQLGTLLYYWSAAQCHIDFYQDYEGTPPSFTPRVFELFNADGSVNQESLEMVSRTFSLDFISDKEKEKWIQEMRKYPKSEQQFFLIPDLFKQKEGWSETVLDAIQERQEFFIFGKVQSEDSIVLASIGMEQAFLNATQRVAGKVVTINPVIGLSSTEDIRKNGWESTRDMAFHFPGVDLPDEADDFYAPWNYFTYHDFYHAVRTNTMGEKWRLKMMKMADELPVEGTKEERLIQECVKDILIDLDFGAFGERNLEKCDAFWLSLGIATSLGKRVFDELSQKTEDKILRGVCKLVWGDTKLTHYLKRGFKNLKRKVDMHDKDIVTVFKSRIFKRLPALWKEGIGRWKKRMGLDPKFLENFKITFLKAKGTMRRKKLSRKFLPYMSAGNVTKLLEFSRKNSIKCRDLEAQCLRFLKKNPSVVNPSSISKA
ncbi:MAG TPA: hypothetical protein VLG76_05805 [Rhabdochlamydiaceae bacterium]|nr:hypothetical protein [Rhabdochlamydiaceae bacterium]